MNSQLKEQRRKIVSAEETACLENKTLSGTKLTAQLNLELGENKNFTRFNREKNKPYEQRLYEKFKKNMEARNLRPMGGKTMQLAVNEIEALPGTYYDICPVWPMSNKSIVTLTFLKKFVEYGNVTACSKYPERKEILLKGYGKGVFGYWTYNKYKSFKLTKEEKIVIRNMRKTSPIFMLWMRCSQTEELGLQGLDLPVAMTAVAGVAMYVDQPVPALCFGGMAMIAMGLEKLTQFGKWKVVGNVTTKITEQIKKVFEGCISIINKLVVKTLAIVVDPAVLRVFGSALATAALWQCVRAVPKLLKMLKVFSDDSLQFQDITPLLLAALVCRETLNPQLEIMKCYRTVSAIYKDIAGTFDISDIKQMVNACAKIVGIPEPFKIYSIMEELMPILDEAEQILTDPSFPIISSTDETHPVKVKKTFDEIDRIDKQIRFFRGIDTSVKVRVLKARNALLDELKRLTRVNKRFESRTMPLCVYFVGPAGGGKTHSQTCLIEALHQLVFDKKLDTANKYVCGGDGFYNGYSLNSWWFHFGEFMTSSVVANNASQAIDFLNFVGTDYAAMDMADVDSKGTMAFCSKVITCTTNDLKCENSGLADRNAILRRPHILLGVRRKKSLPHGQITRKDMDAAWEFYVPNMVKKALRGQPAIRLDHLHPHLVQNLDQTFNFSEVLDMTYGMYQQLAGTASPVDAMKGINWKTELQFQSRKQYLIREYHNTRKKTIIFVKDYEDLVTPERPFDAMKGKDAYVARPGFSEEVVVGDDHFVMYLIYTPGNFNGHTGFGTLKWDDEEVRFELMAEVSLLKVLPLAALPRARDYVFQEEEYFASKDNTNFRYAKECLYKTGASEFPLCRELLIRRHVDHVEYSAIAHFSADHKLKESVDAVFTLYGYGEHQTVNISDVLLYLQSNKHVRLVKVQDIYYIVNTKILNPNDAADHILSNVWGTCKTAFVRVRQNVGAWFTGNKSAVYKTSGLVLLCGAVITMWPNIKKMITGTVANTFQSDQKFGPVYTPLKFQTIYTDMEAKVRNNILRLSLVSDVTSITTVTFIDSQNAYICRHSIEGVLKYAIILGDKGSIPQVTIPGSDIEISQEEMESEKCILHFKKPISYIKNISSCFVDEEINLENKQVWRLMREVDARGYMAPVITCPVYATYKERIQSAQTVSGSRSFSGYWLANQNGSYNGLCGAPYVTEHNGKLVIVGIHFAGSLSTIAFYPVKREAELKFNSLVITDPTEKFITPVAGPAIEGLSYIGKMKKPSTHQPPSRLRPSCLATAVVSEDEPPLPDLNVGRATLHGPISKLAIKFDRRPCMKPNEYVMSLEKMDPLIYLRGFVNPSLIDKRKLKGMQPTIEEVLLGNEYMHSLDDSTSVGPLFKYGIHELEAKDKKDLFCRETGYINPVFLDMCYKRIEEAELLQVSLPVVEGRLKDEMRDKTVKWAEIDSPGGRRTGIIPRMFYASDPLDIVEVKYTLGPIMELMKDVAVCTADMVGINPYSWHWKTIHGRILKRDKFFQTDVKSCEITIMRDFSYTVFEFFNQFFNYTKGTKDWNRLFVCCFKLTRFYLFYESHCYFIEGMNPSGQYVTCLLNGMWIYYMHSSSYYLIAKHFQIENPNFESDVTLITFGDDSITGVSSRASWFNKVNYAKCCDYLYGAKITDLTKEVVHADSTKYDEERYMEFLQRMFVVDGTYVRSPLNPASIHKALMFCAKKMTAFEEQQHFSQIMGMCLFEAMMHGSEFYANFEEVWKPRWNALGFEWRANWNYKNFDLEFKYKYNEKRARWIPPEHFLLTNEEMEDLFGSPQTATSSD